MELAQSPLGDLALGLFTLDSCQREGHLLSRMCHPTKLGLEGPGHRGDKVQGYLLNSMIGLNHRDSTLSLNCHGCSVAKSCPSLCNPMDCYTPDSSVLHYLLEFAEICVQ